MLLLSVIDKPTAFIASSSCLKSLVSFIPGSDKEPLFKYYRNEVIYAIYTCQSYVISKLLIEVTDSIPPGFFNTKENIYNEKRKVCFELNSDFK